MKKIQMPCTEEQFNKDLKPFLVDAEVYLGDCNDFDYFKFLTMPFDDDIKIGTYSELSSYKTIEYNPKEFLKHLGIEIYDVGDVVKIGEYECRIGGEMGKYYLCTSKHNSVIYKQFHLKTIDLKFAIHPTFVIPYYYTLYDLNKTIKFLKSHENKMKEKPFTLEQAKDMLAIESLKELAYKHYPELQSPVNTINEELLSQLSYGMFGDEKMIVVAKASTRTINIPDLDGKAILVQNNLKPVLHDLPTGETIIEFKNK